jgi:hypothetical protein
MIIKLAKKYFLSLFIVATFLGVFHHHNDFQPHNDCQICTIQSNIADADTPIIPRYIQKLEYKETPFIAWNIHYYSHLFYSLYNPRAPPLT